MNALVPLAILGMQTLSLVDKDCKMLAGQPVALEVVDLDKEDMPFRCVGEAGTRVSCLSSRSGKTSEFRIEQEDQEHLILRYVGQGEWTAIIRVDLKTSQFQVASTRPLPGKGLTAELCTGVATYKK
jgi:hypothetical protein